MSSTTYTILRRIDPPEKCYLSEVLLWRAFGRFPEFQFDNSGKDWRFESDVRDGYRAPIPDGFELTEEECRYAGLPDDPQITALLEHGGYLDLEHYDRILTDYENVDGVDQEKLAELRQERISAEKYHTELDEWLVKYEEYVDQFQAEICLKLRRGELRARGTKLPDPDPELTHQILEKNGKWLGDLDVVDIEQERWILQSVDWEDSAIYGHSASFIWIHVYIGDMLRVRPETLSGVAEFSQHETDGSELEESERCAVEVLPVLGQSPAAVEPCDGALGPGLDPGSSASAARRSP